MDLVRPHPLWSLQAAGLLGGVGVFDIVGTIASGALTDRINSRYLLAAYYAFRGAALVFLPWALSYQLAGMWPFAVVYGLDWIATVPPTAKLCSTCFGPRRSAMAFAWCLFFHQLGAAAIAAVAGVLRTQLGSYEWAFWSSGALCVVTAAAVLCISGHAQLPPPQTAPTAPQASSPGSLSAGEVEMLPPPSGLGASEPAEDSLFYKGRAVPIAHNAAAATTAATSDILREGAAAISSETSSGTA
jgi:hypothetical protein